MNSVFEPEEMPLESRLAAIVMLLSASALQGPSAAKTQALRAHLGAAAREQGLPPQLLRALESALTAWHSVEYPSSGVGGPLCLPTLPAQTLH